MERLKALNSLLEAGQWGDEEYTTGSSLLLDAMLENDVATLEGFKEASRERPSDNRLWSYARIAEAAIERIHFSVELPIPDGDLPEPGKHPTFTEKFGDPANNEA